METKDAVTHCSPVEPRSRLVQTLPTFALILSLSALVALPSILAILRRHPHWLAITIVDVLLGWTIVGWVAALVWVLRPVRARKPRVAKATKPRPALRDQAPLSAEENAPANDNATTSADALLAAPAPLDDDVYEAWLERGSAMSESDADDERGDVVTASDRSPSKAA